MEDHRFMLLNIGNSIDVSTVDQLTKEANQYLSNSQRIPVEPLKAVKKYSLKDKQNQE